MLLVQGVKWWQTVTCSLTLGTGTSVTPTLWVEQSEMQTICTQFLARRDSTSRKSEKGKEAQRKCWWSRLRKSPEHPRRDCGADSWALPSIWKCTTPGKDVPDIPSQRFNHLIAEMKTKSFVCCSDPPWAFCGGNSSASAEVRVCICHLFCRQNSRQPGYALWPEWMALVTHYGIVWNIRQRHNKHVGEGAVGTHRTYTHVIIMVKTRKQLAAPTRYTWCALCTRAPCTQASLWNHLLSSHVLQVKNKSMNLLHWVSNKANSKQRTEAQGRRLQWLVRPGRMVWLGKLVGKVSICKLSSEDKGPDSVRPFYK